jgi:hypothetical protein
MRLALAGDVETIMTVFPGEYLRFSAAIDKLATKSRMGKLQSLPPVSVDLHKKNFFIWGDAGTGKTWLAREMCGERPYAKAQNKWWDGWSDDCTGILLNDLVPSQGFNWQTVLDAGDIYPFTAEIKNGAATICPAVIPVICTSNFSPEALMACQPQARIDAFKRRFTIVHVTWIFMGRMKMLHWEYPANSGFQAPKKTWWQEDEAEA